MKKLLAIILAAAMLFSFAACAKEPVAEEPKPEDSVEFTVSGIEDEANKSGSMWELMCRLLPEYVIYKDLKGNFTKTKVNTDLKLNEYDWSSLAGTYKGIDVSYYQGNIDWAKVAASGIKYAIIRAGYRGYTQGTLKEDEKFSDNILGALQNDIPVGVYFVTKAITKEEGIEEADYVLELIKPYNVTWPVVIDIEPNKALDDRTAVLSAAERTEIILAFCQRIEEAGYTPMIYGGVGTFMNHLEIEKLEGVDKWFAQYFNQPYLRYYFGIWQQSESGTVPGIKGNVDIDFSINDYGAANKIKN